jgi:hypothetical protein
MCFTLVVCILVLWVQLSFYLMSWYMLYVGVSWIHLMLIGFYLFFVFAVIIYPDFCVILCIVLPVKSLNTNNYHIGTIICLLSIKVTVISQHLSIHKIHTSMFNNSVHGNSSMPSEHHVLFDAYSWTCKKPNFHQDRDFLQNNLRSCVFNAPLSNYFPANLNTGKMDIAL